MTSAGTVKQAYLFPLNETEGRFLLDAIGLLALSGHGKTADRLPGQTQRAQFVQARVGQCKFREETMALWNDRCALSGVTHGRRCEPHISNPGRSQLMQNALIHTTEAYFLRTWMRPLIAGLYLSRLTVQC